MTEYDFDLDFVDEVTEPEVAYAINRELQLAMQIVEETGANLFLTGKAGTGKTTFLKKLREVSHKRLVVLAPTGVAAINAMGNTIHSFFQLPFSPYIPEKGFISGEKHYLHISKAKRKLMASLSLIVIDEISMVRPDVLDAIDSILRRVRGSSLPFGGVQLLLIGDLRQLPPVVKDAEWSHLADYYSTPYFFDSIALRKAGFLTVELSTVYRQQDREFLHLLNMIRDGKASQETLTLLNKRFRPDFNPPVEEGYIRLTTHTRTAREINQRNLAALPTSEVTYIAEVSGEFPESSYPVDFSLVLKVGAQVMFTKNDTGTTRRYYNGLIGTVTALGEEKISVRPQGMETDVELTPAEWKNTRFVVDETTKQIRQEDVGTFLQYPLQLAWAITVHKSQGLTFDKAIIDVSHSFAPGQTYVALSRCRSLEGLVLSRPVPPSAVITDGVVNDFISHCAESSPDGPAVDSLKKAYLYSLLKELFDFEPLRRSFADFSRYAREYLVPLNPEIEAPLEEFDRELRTDLCEVGRKFMASYTVEDVTRELENPSSRMAQRVKNGCEYFYDKILRLQRFLLSLPKGNIENTDYLKRLNNTFFALKFILDVKAALLSDFSTDDFSVPAYLKAKGVATVNAEEELAELKPARRKKAKTFNSAGNTQKEKKPKKPKGYSTFETLKLYRQGKDVPGIAEERGLSLKTIAGHISDLIKMQRIEVEEILYEETRDLMRMVTDSMPGSTFPEWHNAINGHRGDMERIPAWKLHIFRAVEMRPTGEKQDDE